SIERMAVGRLRQGVDWPNAGNGDTVMKAQKWPNGAIACVLSSNNAPNNAVPPYRFALLDPRGQEIRNFSVKLRTSGGRVDVLANGNVVLPEWMDETRVVEYDLTGNPVWTLDLKPTGTDPRASRPIAAVRLANGNTLVTMQQPNRAAEFDHAGHPVWEYQVPNPQHASDPNAEKSLRINRAFRR